MDTKAKATYQGSYREGREDNLTQKKYQMHRVVNLALT
jgi:hypothetical protein